MLWISGVRQRKANLQCNVHPQKLTSPLEQSQHPRDAFISAPSQYDSTKVQPGLPSTSILLHGGAEDFRTFHMYHDIIGLTAGRELIVVMPDAATGWYSNPVSTHTGARKSAAVTFQPRQSPGHRGSLIDMPSQ